MTKTQVYLPDRELAQLHKLAKRSRRSVADLIREAIRKAFMTGPAEGPVALWKGAARKTSVEHDTIYDEL